MREREIDWERERSEWMEDGSANELWADLDGGREQERYENENKNGGADELWADLDGGRE